MKRLYSNGKLSFWTQYRDKDICVYQIDMKKTFEYESEKIDGQIVDTILLNDSDDTAYYFISDQNNLIAVKSVVVGSEEATYPVIIFDEKRCSPAIQEDNLILITASKNLLSDYPLVKECTKEIDWHFLSRFNTCEIHTNDDINKTEYHNSRLSFIDNKLNFFHFNHHFDEIYANYREEECRISRWCYNVGKKNEYLITQCDDTGETFIYHTHFSERLKYNLKHPQTILTLGFFAIMAIAMIKGCQSSDKDELPPPSNPTLISHMDNKHINMQTRVR